MFFCEFWAVFVVHASNLVLEIVKYDKIWGTIFISVPPIPNSWGDLSPSPLSLMPVVGGIFVSPQIFSRDLQGT